MQIDTANGNIRVIDEDECLGSICGLCTKACPFIPARIFIDTAKNKAVKCDLCLSTPYWEEEGGPGGKQACVEACPQIKKAIMFTDVTPNQQGTVGYNLKFDTLLQ